MKSKILILILALSLISSIGFASPLMDYSKGKASFDLTWSNTELSEALDSGYPHYYYNKSYNFDSTATVGLGNKFAVQYRNFEPKSADNGFDNNELKINEFNVLYKVNKNVAALVGLVTVVNNYYQNSLLNQVSETRKTWQLGMIASTQIAPKTTLWGMAAVGENLTNYEIGVGYQISKKMEFNINYRNLEVKHLKVKTTNESFFEKASGLGYGITYKF